MHYDKGSRREPFLLYKTVWHLDLLRPAPLVGRFEDQGQIVEARIAGDVAEDGQPEDAFAQRAILPVYLGVTPGPGCGSSAPW
jgi:hypothetical protein